MAGELIVDQGWFMGTVQGVHVTFMGGEIDAASFQRYLAATRNEIDQSPADRKRGVLYEVPSPTSTSAAQRKAAGEVLNSRREKLRQITSAYTLVTPSPMVRGMLTAVFWIAPPPYESKVLADEGEGFRWLAKFCPGLDPEKATREYNALRQRCLQEMKRLPRA